MNTIDTSCLDFSPVNCLHPSFILNRDWLDLWRKYGSFEYVDGDGVLHTVPYHLYSHNTDEFLLKYIYSEVYKYLNINNFEYFVFRGRLLEKPVPLFYLFSCGTCELCRQKKSSEYSFRAACETAVYPDGVLFVTLTYKAEFLPRDGVSVSHCQNYFKRLRFWLSSRGLPTDFRYFLVSEYGAKRGRPHYHFLLWNFPVKSFRTFAQMDGALRFAWMTYKLDSDGSRTYRYSRLRKRYYPVRTTIGHVDIRHVDGSSGCASYITRYFNKGSGNLLNYPAKTFVLSSRKGGSIGARYIDSLRDEVINSRLRNIAVYDPVAAKYFSFPVTGYIKYRLFPCRSTYLAREKIYDDVVSVDILLQQLFSLNYYISEKLPSYEMRPRTWNVVRSCLSKLGHWISSPFVRQKYLSYSFYRCLNLNTLLSLLARNVSELKNKLNNLKLFPLDRIRFVFLQNKRFRLYLNGCYCGNRYNIASSLYYNKLSFDRYYANCVF